MIDPGHVAIAHGVGQDAAAVGGDPHRIRGDLQQVAHRGLLAAVLAAAETRYGVPWAVGIAIDRTGLPAAHPQAAGTILADGPDLVGEYAGDRAHGIIGPHERRRTRVADEQPVVVAQPQVAGTVLHDAEIARCRTVAGFQPGDRVRARIEVIQPRIGGDPDAAGMIVSEAVDLAVRGAVHADRIGPETIGRGIEASQAAGIRADQQAAVGQREQAAHIGVRQALGAAARIEHLRAIAVIAGQADHAADPDQATLILCQRGDDRLRHAFVAAHAVEPGGIERCPRITGRGTGHADAGNQQEQPEQVQAGTAKAALSLAHAASRAGRTRVRAWPDTKAAHAAGMCILAFTCVLPPAMTFASLRSQWST